MTRSPYNSTRIMFAEIHDFLEKYIFLYYFNMQNNLKSVLIHIFYQLFVKPNTFERI